MTSDLLMVQTKRHAFLSHFHLLAFTLHWRDARQRPSANRGPPMATMTHWLWLLGVRRQERSQIPCGVRQDRVLWSISNVCYHCVRACSLSSVWLFGTPGTTACHAPLSMGFFRQEYWSGLPFLLQGIFLTQRLNPRLLDLLHWQVGLFFVFCFLPLCHLGSPLDGNYRNSEMLSWESNVSLLNFQPIEDQHIYKDKAKKFIKCRRRQGWDALRQ